MGEEIALENGRISDFHGLVTLTLTLDRVILHTIMHQSSTCTYIPNLIKIEKSFCGRTDVRTDIWDPLMLLGQLGRVNLVKTITTAMIMFMVLSSWQSSSLSSSDKCRLSAVWLLTPDQTNQLGFKFIKRGCYHPHLPLPFVIITQPDCRYSFYHPTRVKGWVGLSTVDVRMRSPCPRLYTAVAVVTNTLRVVRFEPEIFHSTVNHVTTGPLQW